MTHEDLRREHIGAGSSNRGFGLVMGGFFLVVALLPVASGGDVHWWSLAPALGFTTLALAWPRALAPLNRMWMRLGLLLHRLVNPVILGIVFYGVVTPTGLLMRALGKDPLRLRCDPNAGSYWIERDPPGPAPDSLKNQF